MFTGPRDECGSSFLLSESSSNHSGDFGTFLGCSSSSSVSESSDSSSNHSAGCLWLRNSPIVSFIHSSTFEDAIILVRSPSTHVPIHDIFLALYVPSTLTPIESKSVSLRVISRYESLGSVSVSSGGCFTTVSLPGIALLGFWAVSVFFLPQACHDLRHLIPHRLSHLIR